MASLVLTAVSQYLAAELNTTSALANYATEAGEWQSEVQSARAKAVLPFPPTETRGLSPLTLTGMNEHHLSAHSMLVNPASVIVQNAAVSVAPLSVELNTTSSLANYATEAVISLYVSVVSGPLDTMHACSGSLLANSHSIARKYLPLHD
uniref:Uncharacterized protein n=1 Tax=Timema shepardi TaxID=629360 RepID=A0A7R9FVV0_TIMSH|nr:unnamed protein product [Timema shepardi]